MTYRQVHFLEKIEFQVTAIAAAAAVYWFVWPLLIPGDPEWPICFIARGAYAGVLMLAGFACAIGLACGALTVTARPQTAAMALVLGLGGLSLRSPRIRSLLWASEDAMSAMYWRMALEVLVLMAVVVVAAAATCIGRRIMASLAGRLLWRDPLIDLDEDRRAAHHRELENKSATKPGRLDLMAGLGMFLTTFGGAMTPNDENEKLLGRDTTIRGLLGFMISVTGSAIVVFLLLRSPERGQILFALFAGCFLGVFFSQRIVPARTNVKAWVTPAVLGVLLYVLAAISFSGAERVNGIDVACYARVLPIDWMTAGLGGAMLGHWEDLRMREARYIDESLEDAQARDGE